jgi:hypothetical protein
MLTEEIVYDRLIAHEPLTNLVGDRIRPLAATPNSPTFPHVSYDLANGKADLYFDGASDIKRFTLTVKANSALSLEEAQTIAVTAKEVLDGWRGGNIEYCEFQSFIEGELETGGFMSAYTYTLTISQANVQALADSTGTITTGLDSVTLTACEHELTLTCDGLLLDGEPIGQGPAGEGVPEGGLEGQVLAKVSDDDHDTEWRYRIESPDAADVVSGDGIDAASVSLLGGNGGDTNDAELPAGNGGDIILHPGSGGTGYYQGGNGGRIILRTSQSGDGSEISGSLSHIVFQNHAGVSGIYSFYNRMVFPSGTYLDASSAAAFFPPPTYRPSTTRGLVDGVHCSCPLNVPTTILTSGNTGSTETTLYSWTIPSGWWTSTRDALDIEAVFDVLMTGGTTKQIRGYYGGHLFYDSGAVAYTLASTVVARATIWLVSHGGGNASNYGFKTWYSTQSGPDVSGNKCGWSNLGNGNPPVNQANDIIFTAQSSGGSPANNDIRSVGVRCTFRY